MSVDSVVSATTLRIGGFNVSLFILYPF